MLWKITEPRVIRALIKMRRVRSLHRRKEGGIYYSSNFDDYIRRTFGIEKDFFITRLFSKEFGYFWFNKWFIALYEKLRPVYFEFFHDDIKECINSCLEKGYIKQKKHNGKIFIKDTANGRKISSIWRYLGEIISVLTRLRENLR